MLDTVTINGIELHYGAIEMLMLVAGEEVFPTMHASQEYYHELRDFGFIDDKGITPRGKRWLADYHEYAHSRFSRAAAQPGFSENRFLTNSLAKNLWDVFAFFAAVCAIAAVAVGIALAVGWWLFV